MSYSRRPGAGRGRCVMTRIIRCATKLAAPACAGATVVAGFAA